MLEGNRLTPGRSCLVCGAGVRAVELTSRTEPIRTGHFEICSKCGYVSNPGNLHDFRQYKSIGEMALKPRVGTEDRPGREFFMAQMAIEILGRDDLDVLVYSAGRSLDNRHIARLPSVRSVAISDVVRLRDDAEFYDSTQPATRQFPIVLASEVIEHFLNPREDFERLFGFVEKDGLLVCSTNVYDGGNLRRQSYPFIPGHTSYYTPASLAELARANGWSADLRAPLSSTGYAGPRKKYVLFTASPTVRESIEEYFRNHEYAPSEPPWETEAEAH
jgi:Methyltransferase domain